ncbi:MAG: segregation/condensation protein A, partial [Gammaproteobacteria bacterium]|nr:segregation/condensation protein A [Gammaproteobacteria bacterium]
MADKQQLFEEPAAVASLAVVSGEPYVEAPADLFIPPEALRVFLQSFEGPLDLLLYLIRRHD